MQKNNPLITIVIPTSNRIFQLKRLIKSIAESSYRNYEMIVVNDAVEDLPKSLASESIKLINNHKNRGLAYSRTAGAKLAKGKYVLFIDDDNVIDRDMIGGLVSVLETHKEFAATGPLTYFLSDKTKIAFLGATIHLGTSRTIFDTSYEKDNLLEKRYFITGNLHNCFMVRKELGDKVGWFDEKVFMSGTEFDMFQRIKKVFPEGLLVTDTAAACYHDVLSLSKNNLSTFVANYANRKNRIYYYQRNKGLLASRYGSFWDKLLLACIFYPIFGSIYCVPFIYKYRWLLLKENIMGVMSGYKYLMNINND